MDFFKLVDKYLDSSISKEELKTLETLLEDKKNVKFFKEAIKDSYLLNRKNKEFDTKRALNKVAIRINELEKRKVIRLQPVFYKYAAAVTLLLISTIVSFLWLSNETSTASNEIVGKQIQLIQEDGGHQTFSTDQSFAIKNKNQLILGHVDKGKITYTSNKDSKAITYNTVKIPNGKRFQIVLSDGTEVHLNAGSSLRYPTAFLSEKKREVFLEGEAFFKVTKNKEPFIVNAENLDIKVLGTEFNVTAYDKDTFIETTLKEGSVKVTNGQSTILLNPNEQSTWNKSTYALEKKKVNISQYIAWMQGKLVFKNEPFRKIIEELERHYDVKIINGNKELDEERFNASFDNVTIDQVMRYFSRSYGFSYEKVENNITIK